MCLYVTSGRIYNFRCYINICTKEVYVMEATMKMVGAKSTLISISEPKNAILARLQNCLAGNKTERVVCGYSRMHNRHNRS